MTDCDELPGRKHHKQVTQGAQVGDPEQEFVEVNKISANSREGYPCYTPISEKWGFS